MRMILVHLRDSIIFIQAMGNTEGFGAWICHGPVFKSTLDDPKLGDLLYKAFEFSVGGIKHPSKEQWPLVVQPLVDAAGVKSYKAFEKGRKGIKIEEEDGECTLEPSYRGDEQPGKIKHCKLDPAQLQATVLKVMPGAE